ncbi:uncharacterized protein [Procambarus clarkii]|uniref:uncharacterized protein n=1 Tax=Procambarus clarkii TaxID=6728 RepID=UPI001E678252|nr:uncharacterized protein LOC123761980 [Procambarus clarkii]
MIMVVRCVDLLPLVMMQSLLRLTPATARHHHPDTNNFNNHVLQHLYGIPHQDDAITHHLRDTHHDPEHIYQDKRDDPDYIWYYMNDVQQDPGAVDKFFDSVRQDPSVVREHLTFLRPDAEGLRQYLDALLPDSTDIQQGAHDTRQVPEGRQDLDGLLQEYLQDGRQESAFQQNSLDIQDFLAPYYSSPISDTINLGTQRYKRPGQNAGDILQKGGEGWNGVGMYIGRSCWDHFSPENIWCPPGLFQQALSDHLQRHLLADAPPYARPFVMPAPPQALPTHPLWLRKPPTKRYLGIELPDYIATTYSSIKTDNAHYLTKLHQLKQRMRNAGK